MQQMRDQMTLTNNTTLVQQQQTKQAEDICRKVKQDLQNAHTDNQMLKMQIQQHEERSMQLEQTHEFLTEQNEGLQTQMEALQQLISQLKHEKAEIAVKLESTGHFQQQLLISHEQQKQLQIQLRQCQQREEQQDQSTSILATRYNEVSRDFNAQKQ